MRFKVGQAEVRGGKEEVGAERPDDVLKGDASFEDIAHVALDAHCLNAIGLGEMALTGRVEGAALTERDAINAALGSRPEGGLVGSHGYIIK